VFFVILRYFIKGSLRHHFVKNTFCGTTMCAAFRGYCSKTVLSVGACFRRFKLQDQNIVLWAWNWSLIPRNGFLGLLDLKQILLKEQVECCWSPHILISAHIHSFASTSNRISRNKIPELDSTVSLGGLTEIVNHMSNGLLRKVVK
jgi:hypothetical protein